MLAAEAMVFGGKKTTAEEKRAAGECTGIADQMNSGKVNAQIPYGAVANVKKSKSVWRPGTFAFTSACCDYHGRVFVVSTFESPLVEHVCASCRAHTGTGCMCRGQASIMSESAIC